jgi:hypothetical protein
MRDYWLTQDLLKAAGWGYLTLWALALGLAAWRPKRKWVKAIMVIGVLWLGGILPYEGVKQFRQQQKDEAEFRKRYDPAKALFDERCKSAGEKIYKTVDGVEGVLLVNVRPKYSNSDRYDQNWADAGLPRESGGDLYIRRFLDWEHEVRTLGGKPGQHLDWRGVLNPISKAVDGYAIFSGYSFADVKEPDGRIYRYQYKVENTPIGERNELSRDLLSGKPARYSISYKNMTDPADRVHWVAGTTVTVTDTQTNEVMAEKTWYSFEAGLGSRAGSRTPWNFAITCPPPVHGLDDSQTRYFVDQILKPKQGE